MKHWVLAFGGEHARTNYETTMATGEFWVSSDRTPIRRAEPGDHALLYVAGEGFVARAVVGSPARTPYGPVRWSGKSAPLYGISVGGIEAFGSPVLYRFPKTGPHPTLGLHPYALAGGFLAIPEEGFDDVLGWTRKKGRPSPAGVAAEEKPELPPQRNVPEVAETVSGTPMPAAARPERRPAGDGPREKRAAGQHALKEGRKRETVWRLAEAVTYDAGLKEIEKHAQGKVREARRTWLKGGRAEERVGVELEGLREHGFYIFHESHAGRVERRGADLLVNGRPPEKDFIKQAWRVAYRLREVLNAEVVPLLCFTEAFVDGRLYVRGVRVLPLRWLAGEILGRETARTAREIKLAAGALGSATGCYPSAVPCPRS